MLLVHDHQAQLGQRCEHRQPCADHHPRAARLGIAPGAQALAVGQTAVQCGQRHVREARLEAPDQLRSQVDFRDQDERLAPARQHLGDHREVDFGLAAAGDSAQEKGGKLRLLLQDRAHAVRLIRGELGSRCRIRRGRGRTHRFRTGDPHAFDQSGSLELGQCARRRRRECSQSREIHGVGRRQRGEDAPPGDGTLGQPRQVERAARRGESVAAKT